MPKLQERLVGPDDASSSSSSSGISSLFVSFSLRCLFRLPEIAVNAPTSSHLFPCTSSDVAFWGFDFAFPPRAALDSIVGSLLTLCLFPRTSTAAYDPLFFLVAASSETPPSTSREMPGESILAKFIHLDTVVRFTPTAVARYITRTENTA